MTRRLFAVALIALAATAAAALERPSVLVTYGLKAGTRPIAGVSRELEWLFQPFERGRAGMQLRVPIDSFVSGDPKFDAAFRQAIDSRRYPWLQIEGIAREGLLEGTVQLGGIVRDVVVRLHRERDGDDVLAIASVELDLRDFRIALAGVDPRLSLDLSARLVMSDDAVIAGGYMRGAQ